MTGPELRAALALWNVSARLLADSLASIGYMVRPSTIIGWKDSVPPTAQRLIERWADNPSERPAKLGQRHVK